MRKKEEKLLITFHTTAEAMATEKACHNLELAGRLIPVPREVSAGCGFVWCAPPQLEAELKAMLQEQKIEYETILQMMV